MSKKKPESKEKVTKRKFLSPIRTYEVTLSTGAVHEIKCNDYILQSENAYFDIDFKGNYESIRIAEFNRVVSIVLKDDLTTELADCMELKETVQ